ncbi:hypothetical protein K0M31_003700 [Melipona bicolor]|uniref:Uncharacterized protein n=1 Tax=Melipona bicolor TaxID=60889 RepID=A0AA40FXD9_9HYME|nr:hypothetical protein K0M31_003700 [Melipona bicolor]
MAERAAARGAHSGRDVDVWQGSYLDVQTFNGRCVTYREETPHSLMLDAAASNSHLACPSFYRGVIKYGEIRGLSLRRPPERASPAATTGLRLDLRLVGPSVLGEPLAAFRWYKQPRQRGGLHPAKDAPTYVTLMWGGTALGLTNSEHVRAEQNCPEFYGRSLFAVTCADREVAADDYSCLGRGPSTCPTR